MALLVCFLLLLLCFPQFAFGMFVGIGSGGPYALAAARALINTDLPAREIAERAMRIAADICVYTNHNFTIESFQKGESKETKKDEAENKAK